jgi:zinc transport system substrate-binding protein
VAFTVALFATGPATAGSARADDFAVVATIKPIHSLVSQVMLGVGTPALLVQGNASPHSYALKPSDARALNSARVVFRVSEQVEPFTRRIVASLPKSTTVVTLSEAPGLKRLAMRDGDTFERHDHIDDHHAHAIEHATTDGHVWLDPENAKAMVAEIVRALKVAAPQHAAALNVNAAKAVADLDSLTSEIDAALAPIKDKPFVVFHDAYQYFETRFGVTAIGSVTLSPEVQPSAKRLSAVRAKIKALKAACVFAEPQFKSKLIETVLEGTGAKAGTLDPEGGAIEPGPGAYAQLLRGLARDLTGCLRS